MVFIPEILILINIRKTSVNITKSIPVTLLIFKEEIQYRVISDGE